MLDFSFIEGIRRLARHLSPLRKWQLKLLFVLMLCGALAELVSLGAVVPFVTVLASPAQAAEQPVLRAFMAIAHIDAARLPMAISLVFALLVLLAAAVRLALLWASFKFSYGWGHDLSRELYGKTLHRPYSFHISRNSSEIIGAIGKVQLVIGSYIIPLLNGLIAAILAVTIVITLVAIDPVVAIGGAAVFGASYFLIAVLVRKRLRLFGVIFARTNDQRIQAVQEGLGGIRDVILDRAQSAYEQRFAKLDDQYRAAQAQSEFLGGSPRIVIEALGMLLIAGFALAYSVTNAGIGNLLPVLGALAVGAQRLMPLIQQMYRAWTAATSGHASLKDVLELIDYTPPPPVDSGSITFRNQLALEDVRFHYGAPASPLVLRSIDLAIRRGEKIGVIGITGSGKTTLVDLLMGLLSPTGGRFMVDGSEVTQENASAWQRHIAHVPQSIFLSDATLAENIAFGVETGAINMGRLEAAARAAQIHEHIATLPEGYRTRVGERGVKLSGGQRQRVGIARALYRQADVLVLDEATSALDDGTEAAVMAGVHALAADLTIIMIAHRLSTLKSCDRIIELQQGRIVGVASYDEVLARRERNPVLEGTDDRNALVTAAR